MSVFNLTDILDKCDSSIAFSRFFSSSSIVSIVSIVSNDS